MTPSPGGCWPVLRTPNVRRTRTRQGTVPERGLSPCDVCRDRPEEPGSVPGRRVVYPGPAEHRRNDLHLGQLARRGSHRIAVEDDEVGAVAGKQLAAAPLVACKPGRIDGRGLQRLLDGQRLFGVPGRPRVERAQYSRADAGERIELLDRRVRAVGD